MTERYVAPERDIDLQGHYAGPVSRLLAFAADVFVLATIFAILLALFKLAWEVVLGQTYDPSANGAAISVAYLLWAVLYFALPWAMSGKSVGMAILGVRVRRTDGSPVDGKHALIRVVTLPLSFLLLGIGLLMGLVNRQHRCLHDRLADTIVVYSWDARRAQLRLLTRQTD